MDSKCDFLKKIVIFLRCLILWYVFFKMTHVLPLISAQNGDKNALQNRRGRPVLNKFGSLTVVFSVLSFSQNLTFCRAISTNVLNISLCMLAALYKIP